MNIEDLPDEVLALVLNSVPGKEVFRCRRVCQRWQEVVDNLPDSFWQSICSQRTDYFDFELISTREYSRVHNKCGISWKTTYKALNSWHRIKQLPMTIHQPAFCSGVNGFQILPNGIIALTKNSKYVLFSYVSPSFNRVSDTVVYYDLETSQECGKEEVDFHFKKYEENEHFRVFQKVDGEVVVTTKVDRQSHSIPAKNEHHKFTLLDDEVYSYHKFPHWCKPYTPETVIRSKIVKEGDRHVLKLDSLEYIDSGAGMAAVTKKDGKIFALSDSNAIYMLIDDEFEYYEREFVGPMYELDTFGFNWRTPDICEDSMYYCKEINMPFSTYYGHGDIFVQARRRHRKAKVNIVKYDGEWNFEDVVRTKPKLTIDLSDDIRGRDIVIHQLDIIETDTHHKILVLAQSKVYFLEFAYC